MSLSERLRPDVEATPWVIEEVKKLEVENGRLRESRNWYMHRYDELQQAQRHMRDPERKAVCDILANGKTTALTGKEVIHD